MSLPNLLSPQVTSSLPPHIKLRFLHSQDYKKGFLQTLSQLSDVGSIDTLAFHRLFNQISGEHSEEASSKDESSIVGGQDESVTQTPSSSSLSNTFILVLEDVERAKIIASGTLLVERKFLHQGGLAGHIEDVVCDEGYRGLSLGKKLIAALVHLARVKGCYKVILDCNVSIGY
jgi:glucosamine-phosphate N-acetyltransferase